MPKGWKCSLADYLKWQATCHNGKQTVEFRNVDIILGEYIGERGV